MRHQVVLLSVVIGLASGTGAAPVQHGHDWPTFDRDARRSGASPDPTGISASNVASLKRQQVPLEGTIDASVIYLSGAQVRGSRHNAFFGTTTYGKTIAIDADSGAVLWTYTPKGYTSWAGSARITTATPVADPERQFIYAASPDGHIQKLAVADGHAVWNSPITTLPDREKIASALTVANHHVIAVTGGYIGDAPPYQGHVAVLNPATGQLDHVWNSLCSDRARLLDPRACPESDSAIWGRAGAVIDPSSGHLFIATGNAKWDGNTYWGDSTLELDADATRLLGNYTPANTEQLNETDRDIGSTSPVLIGDGYLLQGGKDGLIRVLGLQQIAGAAPHRGGELQTVKTPSGTDLFTAPAVEQLGGAPWVFAADNGGTAAWVFQNHRLEPKWDNTTGGTSPVLAGGLLYVYDPHGGLYAYDPASGRRIATLECGGGHWNSPIVVDGRIALPEGNANSHQTSGVLDIWRLPG
ncbi:MAG: PQQ-binding-like beta-propeller repeat protein [Vicinamibacterales bacterium]